MPTFEHVPDDICTMCNKTHPWPDGTIPRHPFNDGSLPASATFGAKRADGSRGPAPVGSAAPVEAVVEAQWPWDPVLRQALISRGVITPDDLVDAEKHIRAVTAQFKEMMTNDTPPTPGG